MPAHERRDALASLHRVLIDSVVEQDVQGAASHPEDDLVLATALSANVDVLVTGDKQLLVRDGYKNLRIMTPRAFLDILQQS